MDMLFKQNKNISQHENELKKKEEKTKKLKTFRKMRTKNIR